MSIEVPLVIDSSNLSAAWARAFVTVMAPGRGKLTPFSLSIGNFDAPLPDEDEPMRTAVDDTLRLLGGVPSDISAMTIFPHKMWVRRGRPPCDQFSALCTQRLFPRLRKLDKRNRYGTYFERMMTYTGVSGGKARDVNQLQFVIDLLRKGRRPRDSALQLACFDAAKDHTGQPVRGFPCLQQVGISCDNHGNLAVNAFYPVQYIFDRAYGNYLGLCQLGDFIANQTGRTFSRMTCFIGKPERGSASKSQLAALLGVAKQLVDRTWPTPGDAP